MSACCCSIAIFALALRRLLAPARPPASVAGAAVRARRGRPRSGVSSSGRLARSGSGRGSARCSLARGPGRRRRRLGGGRARRGRRARAGRDGGGLAPARRLTAGGYAPAMLVVAAFSSGSDRARRGRRRALGARRLDPRAARPVDAGRDDRLRRARRARAAYAAVPRGGAHGGRPSRLAPHPRRGRDRRRLVGARDDPVHAGVRRRQRLRHARRAAEGPADHRGRLRGA